MAEKQRKLGAVIYSDRKTQYTGETCRKAAEYGIRQNMNSAGGRCRDNVRCESMRTSLLWPRSLLFLMPDKTALTNRQHCVIF